MMSAEEYITTADKDIRLTPHFTLGEMTASDTAAGHGIDNTPRSGEHILNLCNLCREVLEPLREQIRAPVQISSGYRCPELNRMVGGSANSQHMTGEAADIPVPDAATGRRWMEWIVQNCVFDQCIWESGSARSFWIHVSCRRALAANRFQVIGVTAGKGAVGSTVVKEC